MFFKDIYQYLRTFQQRITRRMQMSYILENYIHPLIVSLSVKHVYGPRRIKYNIDELLVLCLLRDGELYITSFIHHYFSLGVKHIVFLDNGSTDDTIKIARQHENVTILRTKIPYRKYETFMKKYLVKRFSRNRWNLFSDIDELFDYPYSDKLGLKSFLNYLNANSYTAVLAHMLDMFSEVPLGLLKSDKSDDLKKTYTFYDISNLRRERYPSGYGDSKENINWHIGGVRKTLFNTDNYLTKAALILYKQKMRIFVNCHQVEFASIADVTTVLLHYPFTSLFYKKVADAVETDRYASSASQEYEMYWKRLQEDKNLPIKQENACQLTRVDELIERDFLVISESYVQWVKQYGKAAKSINY